MANVVIKPEPIYVNSSRVVGLYSDDTFGGSGLTPAFNQASSVFHSYGDYTIAQSGFSSATISSDHSFVFIFYIGTESTGDYKAIMSAWDNSGNQRGFMIRFEDGTNKLELLTSGTGDALDVRILTTNGISSGWHCCVITTDVSAGTITDAIKIYIDGLQVSYGTPITDTGDYTIYNNAEVLTIGAIHATGVLDNYNRGGINQIAITSSVIPESTITAMGNGANVRLATLLSDIESSFEPQNNSFSGGYTFTDSVTSNDWVQAGSAFMLREAVVDLNLNPSGGSYNLGYLGDTDFFSYLNQTGVSGTLSSGVITINLTHTGVSDPSRESYVYLSRGSYSLDQDLWIMYTTYDWGASIDEMSHGFFGVQGSDSDLTYASSTHRVIAPNLANLGNYRCVGAQDGIQTGRDETTTISKGKDVIIRISGTTVSYYYNNGGVLTTLASDQTIDFGDSVRIRAHARDYNKPYAAPDQYFAGPIWVGRLQPTLT